MGSLHTVECISALKKEPATTWVSTEVVLLSERTNTVCFLLGEVTEESQKQKAERCLPGARGRGGKWGFVGSEFQCGQMKKFWRWVLVMVNAQNCAFRNG